MKNLRKYAAIAGVVLLLGVCVLTMISALGNGEGSQAMFRAAFAVMLILPVLLYVFLMTYKFMNRNKTVGSEGGNTGSDKAMSAGGPVIKNVVFDIGKVLMSFEPEAFLKEMGYSGEKYEKIAQATFLSDVWQERDRGVLTEEEYVAQCVALAPEYEADIRKVMSETHNFVKLYPYARTWVEYLKKKGYRLFIISNFCEYMTEKNVKNMPFRKFMDGEIFSYKVNELKPDPVIFQLLLDKYFLNPEECVMIDDRPENCEGARSVGMKAIEFKSFKQAAAELEKLGVK